MRHLYLPISDIVKYSDTFRRGKLKKNPVREEISQIGNKTCYGKSRTKFTRHGKAVAAIVPMEDREILVELEAKVDVKKYGNPWSRKIQMSKIIGTK